MASNRTLAIVWHELTCAVIGQPRLVMCCSTKVTANRMPVHAAIRNSFCANELSQLFKYTPTPEVVSVFDVSSKLICHKLNRGKMLGLCGGARRCEQIDASLTELPVWPHRDGRLMPGEALFSAPNHLLRERHAVMTATRVSP